MTDNSSIDFSLTNIYRTWRALRAGKKTSRAILEYEANLENNLIKLCLAIKNNTYQHGGYEHKILSDKKRRDIAVASVQDRIVHRLLYDHLVQKLDRRFDPDVWSGRKGKGLHGSLKQIAYLVDKYHSCYVWRADIEKFFDNVDHQILKSCLARHIKDEAVQKLLDKVIDSYTHNEKSVSQSRHGYTNWQFDQSNTS
jgi:retron-type reverse transcriptase